MVSFHAEDLPGWNLPQAEEVAEWLADIAERHNRHIGHINYIFSTDEYVRYLNKTYLQHDYETDILTFDYTEEGCTALTGDLFLSLERIMHNATAYGESVVDELHRVMVHGLLHLIGFDDSSEKQQAEMRKQEDLSLALRMF